MASGEESSLLSKLESPNLSNLFPSFSSFLQPLSSVPGKPFKNPSKSQQQTQIRSLAKQFLPFLNRSLSLLPKRILADHSNLTKESSVGLFETYKLCLNCLELVSSQLACKPWAVDEQRVKMLHCYMAAGRYQEAEREAFSILERLKKYGEKEKERELGALVVEVVVTIVKCTAMKPRKDSKLYKRILGLVEEEVPPWFKLLNGSNCEKLRRALVTYLEKCTLFLIGELAAFDSDLVYDFFAVTLAEYVKSSVKDQIYKFGRRICSVLFSLQEDSFSLTTGMLHHLLNSLAEECKVELRQGIDFVDLVCYCANKCRHASQDFSCAVATHFKKIADGYCKVLPHFCLILRLYAAGLSFCGCYYKPRGEEYGPKVKNLLDDKNGLHEIADLLGSLERCFHIGRKTNGLLTSGCKNSTGHVCPCMGSDCRANSITEYFPSLLNALKFLCWPLADMLNCESKYIVTDDGDASAYSQLCDIQNMFILFSDLVLFCCCTAEEGKYMIQEDNKLMLRVLVAAFTISFRTRVSLQKCMDSIEHVIASEWMQPQGLKFLFASLYNVGLFLYRDKRVEEASKALKLSCRASWTCVVVLCQMLVNKSRDCNVDYSEDAVLDFLSDTSMKSAFLLDILHQCASDEVNKVITSCLDDWLAAEDMCRNLSVPASVLKQWVKIGCKRNGNEEVDDVPTTYCLLSSSRKVSKRAIGAILEQEILAYEELGMFYSKFCRRMQLKIIGILLKNVYVTQDCVLRRSRLLIKKGRLLRILGTHNLRDSVQCLTEAINTISDMHTETCNDDIAVCHQLAVTHCLRSLFTQEIEPNSELVFEDISAALRLWLYMPIPDCCPKNVKKNLIPDNIILLYNVVDLLSLKGCVKFHHDIYKLIIRFFTLSNLPVEKCLTVLWKWRRLSHCLCVSPISDAFIASLSEHCGELPKCIDFWISCLKASEPLVIGFQQTFSFLVTALHQDSNNHKSSFRSDITVNEANEAASVLISDDPVHSDSAFLASFLYYNLSERLASNGKIFKALTYAKEAHRLRTMLFREKFKYSVEEPLEKYNDIGKVTQKVTYGLSNFQLIQSVAGEIWSYDTISWDLEGAQLSPWNVLQCYLESTLQVGILHEIVGNGAEAEAFLLWGKNISCIQRLPVFTVAYSAALGKLYRKKRDWNLAEKELQNAKKLLLDSGRTISCPKCSLHLQIMIDQQFGDLFRSQFDTAAMDASTDRLYCAENLYRAALERLCLSEWKSSISCPKGPSSETSISRTFVSEHDRIDTSVSTSQQSATGESCTKREDLKTRTETKQNRRTTNASKPLQENCSSRVTRSRYRAIQNQSVSVSSQIQIVQSRDFGSDHESECSDILCLRDLLSKMNSLVNFASEATCICNTNCWQCLSIEVLNSGRLDNFINLKWEYIRRRLSLRLLSGVGKCLRNLDQIHQTHVVYWQSISVLVSRNSFCHVDSSASPSYLLDLVGKEIPGDVFAVERAATLYNLCWFLLKGYQSRDARASCCSFSNIKVPRILSWLILAFILSQDVPVLFQKVSRLLSIFYILFGSGAPIPLPYSCKTLSETHWASYFHQASVGTHLNHQFFSTMSGKLKTQYLFDTEKFNVRSSCMRTERHVFSPRLAPESIQDLEEFVANFFDKLPCTTVICMTLLGDDYTGLFRELLHHPSSAKAWLLLSRLNSTSQPIVMLKPVGSIVEEASGDNHDDSASSGKLSLSENFTQHWHCPWGSTVIDDIAPVFKNILEENYISSSIPVEDTKENRLSWWAWRKKLDDRLGELLRNLEDSWVGPWRYLFLGELSNQNVLNSVHKKLIRNLKSKCKIDVNESVVKVILGSDGYAFESHECMLKLLLCNGCYISRGENCCDERHMTLSNGCRKTQKLSGLCLELLQQAVGELEEEDFSSREPMILVLDYELQMLPWENIPILRNQEVYRMPSVGSISVMLNGQNLEKTSTSVAIPLIDPLDAFYLLNPSGDLSRTQVEFEKWFREQNLKGKAGSAPTAEELAAALESHDLFIYFGHGSGVQYIRRDEIQKLENCAATLLMGCSSGSLSLDGCYIPRGIPLSYLLAGSPVIVANLWEVTDKDIDRFGKAILDAWLRERSSPMGCVQCNLVAKEFEALNINGKGVPEKKVRENSKEACDSSCSQYCHHIPRVGSYMSKAREACTLPFLIGAAPVCYGVPTGIKRKELRQ